MNSSPAGEFVDLLWFPLSESLSHRARVLSSWPSFNILSPVLTNAQGRVQFTKVATKNWGRKLSIYYYVYPSSRGPCRSRKPAPRPLITRQSDSHPCRGAAQQWVDRCTAWCSAYGLGWTNPVGPRTIGMASTLIVEHSHITPRWHSSINRHALLQQSSFVEWQQRQEKRLGRRSQKSCSCCCSRPKRG